MAKVKLPYKVDNTLDSFIVKEIGRRMYVNGIKVTKTDVINELAKHCGVGYENINRIKRGISLPSLGVALKMSEYFNVKIEDIFKIA